MFLLNYENFVNQDSCLMFVKMDIRKKMCYARGSLRCIEKNELIFISFLRNPLQ